METLINAIYGDLMRLEQRLEGVNTTGRESVKALSDVFTMLNQMKNGLTAILEKNQPRVEVEKVETDEGE